MRREKNEKEKKSPQRQSTKVIGKKVKSQRRGLSKSL